MSFMQLGDFIYSAESDENLKLSILTLLSKIAYIKKIVSDQNGPFSYAILHKEKKFWL